MDKNIKTEDRRQRTEDRKRKIAKIRIAVILMVSMFGITGCAKQLQVEPIEQICIAGVSGAEAMSAAEAVLGKMHFTIEKADAEAGYLRTRPLAAGQWFEFWREDNVGEFNKAEANLQTIRRTAEVEINEQDGKVCVVCGVTAERLNLSEKEIQSTSSARGLFTKNKGAFQRLELDPEQKKAWSDLGEDKGLSSLILKRIEERLKEVN